MDTPSASKKEMRTLTADELGILLKAAEGNPYYLLIYTAVSSGLRQGELLALCWRDLDLPLVSISVSRSLSKRHRVCTFKEPKTTKSRRKVRMTPKLKAYLASYRADREAFCRQLENPLTLDDLVFVTPEGNPIDPGVLSHAFHKLVKQAGLEGVRFHDLRHSFASIMLKRGAKPKVISEALGHASVAFTMDVYCDSMDGMQEEAMGILDKVMPEGVPAAISA